MKTTILSCREPAVYCRSHHAILASAQITGWLAVLLLPAIAAQALELRIDQLGPGQIRLSWEETTRGVVIEMTDNLSPSGEWTPVSVPFQRDGLNLSANIVPGEGSQFFRLRKTAAGRTIAITGQTAPGGEETFELFSTPVTINDSEQVVFIAGFLAEPNEDEASRFALFRSDSGRLTTIARHRQLVPNANDGEYLYSLSAPHGIAEYGIDKRGRVGFQSWIYGGEDTFQGQGIFLFDEGTLRVLARTGQPLPGEAGQFPSGLVAWFNDLGHAAIVSGSPSEPEIPLRIHFFDGETLSPMVRVGQAIPDGAGIFESIRTLDLANDGTLLFYGSDGDQGNEGGIFSFKAGQFSRLHREGESAPDGDGIIAGFLAITSNPRRSGFFAGSVSFEGSIGDPPIQHGICLFSENEARVLVRSGQPAPDGEAIIGEIGHGIGYDASGQVAFFSTLRNENWDMIPNEGTILLFSMGHLRTIVRVGMPSPDGNGMILNLYPFPVINQQGVVKVVFSDNEVDFRPGIILSDGTDSLAAVRIGEWIAGSSLADFSTSYTRFNKFGQFAYLGELADGREVVQVYTPPLYWRSRDMVLVGNAGNAPDATGFGAVAYEYRIGRTEVSNFEYAQFLNAKAAADPLGLYHPNMASDGFRGGILREGTEGQYTYRVKPDMGDKPVNWVSWNDAIRFVNWLHNGQGAGDTESGAYALLGGGIVPTNVPTRHPDAQWFLPNENEWYKAAYHQPAADGGDADDYWLYPTAGNFAPAMATADSIGDISNPGVNVANFNSAADWNGQNGHVTTVGSAGPESESYYGTLDQGGNVLEWTEELVSGSFRTRRGGAFNSGAVDLSALSSIAGIPSSENMFTGFRVARRVNGAAFSYEDPGQLDATK